MFSWLAAVADTAARAGWGEVIIGLLNVLQTLALAYMAGRSRRVRAQDRAVQRVYGTALDRRARD